MPIHRYFLSDFVTIQRQSFFELLEKGLVEEFSKRNPITNTKKDLEFLFYPEYYILTRPEYTPQEAIVKNKSYTSKLFVPGQLTDLKSQKKIFKWFYIGNLPLMTKRGHFILNGAARVIVNQILRSPGIYYQQKIYENYEEKWSQKPDDTYKRFYADLICMRGTWLRIEIDKDKNIWAQMKKGPKIPIYWFLLAMGLSEKKILKTITDSFRLLGNLSNGQEKVLLRRVAARPSPSPSPSPLDAKQGKRSTQKGALQGREPNQKKYAYLKNPPEAWQEIFKLLSSSSSLVANSTKNKNMETHNSSALPLTQRVKGSEAGEGKSSSSLLSSSLLSSSMFPFSTPLSFSASSSKRDSNYKGLLLPSFAGTEEQDFSSLKEGRTNKNETNQSAFININERKKEKNLAEEGRKWLYNKFMNPRSYNLGKQGRLAFNRKLGLNISTAQTTLTGLDVLYATDYLIKVEKGVFKIDDIDHLKNRRVRTSGELIQIQIGVGVVRLEKAIRENLNKLNLNTTTPVINMGKGFPTLVDKNKQEGALSSAPSPSEGKKKRGCEAGGERWPPSVGGAVRSAEGVAKQASFASLVVVEGGTPTTSTRPFITPALRAGSQTPSLFSSPFCSSSEQGKAKSLTSFPPASQGGGGGRRARSTGWAGEAIDEKKNLLINLINSKAFNSAIREFFGTSPLSQFMDQINPLAELTHKRRLSSMGPGGVTRDTATLAIRGIHPTHYGRICPIETPEGKNTGLVNSMTTYARVNSNGIIESPFYKVYKGQVQKNTGMYYFSAEQEEKIQLAAADLATSSIGFLPKSFIPVRIAEDFTKIPRSQVQYVGISPLQMISIAASLIPFLEHDDANRALMGSNMQRQAVPLIKPERPIVGTGLEARAISDSGHAILAKFSGLVTYVSSQKIVIYRLVSI